MKRPDAKACDRFMSHVEIAHDDGCWLWRGGKGSRGYGQFSYESRSIRAHRFAWLMEHGDLPSAIFVCHRCDNPACVRPAHLFLGDHRANVDDMVAKGRARTGERHGNSKLTETMVRDIVSRWPRQTHKAISEATSVKQSTVSAILSGRLWRKFTGIERRRRRGAS